LEFEGVGVYPEFEGVVRGRRSPQGDLGLLQALLVVCLRGRLIVNTSNSRPAVYSFPRAGITAANTPEIRQAELIDFYEKRIKSCCARVSV